MKTAGDKQQKEDSFNVSIIKMIDSVDFSMYDAFVRGAVVDFGLIIAAEAEISGAEMVIANLAGEIVFQKKMARAAKEGVYFIFSVSVDTDEVATEGDERIFRYQFILDTAKGAYRVKRKSKDILLAVADTLVGGWEDTFLLTLYDAGVRLPEWLYGGIVYYIFVDRFHRAGDFPLRGDAILNADWENGCPSYGEYPAIFHKNNVFFGGNLRGIAKKLEHIYSLGTTCICLSPIFESESNHRFDTADFMRIDDMIGGEGAFHELVSKAAGRDIRIILDVDFGITSDNSRYFNKYGRYEEVGAYQSRISPYRGWYTFYEEGEGYDCRFSLGNLPRLNWNEPSCKDFFVKEGGVVAGHIAAGAYGYRLNYPNEFSRETLRAISGAVKREKEGGVVYGVMPRVDMEEIVAINSLVVEGCIDSFINYGVREAIIRYLREGDFNFFKNTVGLVCAMVPSPALNLQLNPLGDKDTDRIITALAGEEDTGRKNAERAVMRLREGQRRRGVKLLKLAYLIAATLPGLPFIYYGDETGLEGYGDPFNRRCFPWHKTEGSLIRWYKKVGKMRREHTLFKDAPLKINFATEDLLIFSRNATDTAAITVINRSNRTYRLTSKNRFASMLSNVPDPATVIDVPPLSGTVLLSAFDEKGMAADFNVLRR